MPVEIAVPELGESVVEATVGTWRKRAGERVEAGEVLVELETDKVNLEVAAPQAGVLASIAHAEGDAVRVGEVLATVDLSPQPPPLRGEGEPEQAAPSSASATTAAPPATAPAVPPATAPAVPPATRDASVGASGGRPVPTAAPSPGTPASSVGASGGRPAPTAPDGSASGSPPLAGEGVGERSPLATPLARRVAEEHGLDLRTIVGTGPGGRVTHDDVNALLARAQPSRPVPPTGNGAGVAPTASVGASAATPLPHAEEAPGVAAASVAAPSPRGMAPTPQALSPVRGRGEPEAAAPREERVRMSRRRQTIARRLVEAQHTAAMLTTFNEVDMSAIMELRKRRRDAFKERHGVGLGFMSFFTRAAVGALKAYPRLNAELQGDEMVLKHYYDIGIAVSTEEGLVVPVVRDADRLSFAEIERRIAALAEQARNRTLSLDDLRGGTFTITNGGVFGSLLSTPILNGPQAAILGMHKIEERPIALGGQVVIRPMMYLAVSYDHRLVDGAESVSFLVRVKELLEDPEALLLEG
jgi:2-oxoglutarate dehydrogenase E2 component (dihydrolipoamide succinyltransferase)